MLSNTTRVLAFTSALFLAGMAAATAAAQVHNFSSHGPQPHSHGFVASHGMMGSNKHQFDSIHHFASSKPPGHHGFSNGNPNKRKH